MKKVSIQVILTMGGKEIVMEDEVRDDEEELYYWCQGSDFFWKVQDKVCQMLGRERPDR